MSFVMSAEAHFRWLLFTYKYSSAFCILEGGRITFKNMRQKRAPFKERAEGSMDRIRGRIGWTLGEQICVILDRTDQTRRQVSNPQTESLSDISLVEKPGREIIHIHFLNSNVFFSILLKRIHYTD